MIEASKLQDIKLSFDWQPTPDVTGDFLRTTSDYECILQEIQLEALTQEGDLFYDEGFGWTLLDFIQTENDELEKLEIQQRIVTKLSWYEEIDKNSINVEITVSEKNCKISVKFKFIDSENEYMLHLQLDRINAEVVIASD